MSTKPVVELEMFLDVSCPWCHGALETNRRILDELIADPDMPALKLKWRFMRLHELPFDGPIPLDSYFSSWGDDSPQGLEKARNQILEFTDSVGAIVNFKKYDTLYDPFSAHRLLCAVRDDNGDDLPSVWSVVRIVFNANFVHGLDITSMKELRYTLEHAGLKLAERIWKEVEVWDGHRAEALQDHERALEVNLDGVPRIVVAGKTIVPTWVDPNEVRKTLREAITSSVFTAK